MRSVERRGTDFACFDIELPAVRADGVQIGASVAINGTCLTVVAQEGATLRFDVMGETLRRTNLGGLDSGSAVNFERSARVGDEIGGHTVSGHVHTTARIVDVQDSENNKRVEFEVRRRDVGCLAHWCLLSSWATAGALGEQEASGLYMCHKAGHAAFADRPPHPHPPTHTP